MAWNESSNMIGSSPPAAEYSVSCASSPVSQNGSVQKTHSLSTVSAHNAAHNTAQSESVQSCHGGPLAWDH
eukprot:SAG31_NODE_23352_length_506_cov_0.796069_1_plen_70_part_10